MHKIQTSNGIHVSYAKHAGGAGAPPLVLVHGGFSDHWTNWEFVLPSLTQEFTVYAIARRGRGQTSSTTDHRVEDEASDLVELIRTIGAQVFLLGHSYGAQVALRAATMLAPAIVRRLILYEPPRPSLMGRHMEKLEAYARDNDWSGMSYAFFHEVLQVPAQELHELKNSELWAPIVADAKASLGDLRALTRYDFDPELFRRLRMPVLLQIGSLSPRKLYATDLLAPVLPDVAIESLDGQAHEAMTTAPQQYVRSVVAFLNHALV